MEKVKRIDIKEFREKGFLQEANRQFFHPLGLALEIIIDDDTGEVKSLGGVWDYRDDPEGMFYGNDLLGKPEALKKASYVEKLRESKVKVRVENEEFNCDLEGIQQIPQE
jgi:hypothetical protein